MKLALVLAAWLGAGAAAGAQEPAGKALFAAAGCRACHRVGAEGGNSGPDLTLVGFRRKREWLERWLADPSAWKHDTLMPNFRLKASDRAGLVDYLSSLKGRDWDGRPP